MICFKVTFFHKINGLIKQIMTGLEGNRQIYLPREIQDRLPKSSIDLGFASVNRTLVEAILNLKGQIDSLLPKGPVIICFIIPLCHSKEKNDYFNLKLISSTMGLVTKKV